MVVRLEGGEMYESFWEQQIFQGTGDSVPIKWSEDKPENMANPDYKTYKVHAKKSVCYPKIDAEVLKHVLGK